MAITPPTSLAQVAPGDDFPIAHQQEPEISNENQARQNFKALGAFDYPQSLVDPLVRNEHLYPC